MGATPSVVTTSLKRTAPRTVLPSVLLLLRATRSPRWRPAALRLQPSAATTVSSSPRKAAATFSCSSHVAAVRGDCEVLWCNLHVAYRVNYGRVCAAGGLTQVTPQTFSLASVSHMHVLACRCAVC
jgi:hypothetical protein